MGGGLQKHYAENLSSPLCTLLPPKLSFSSGCHAFWEKFTDSSMYDLLSFHLLFQVMNLRQREMLLIVSTASGELSMWKVVWTVWFCFLKLPIRTSLCKQLCCAVRISGKLKLRCLKRLFHSSREWRNWFSAVYTDDPSVCLKPSWSACISTPWVNC